MAKILMLNSIGTSTANYWNTVGIPIANSRTLYGSPKLKTGSHAAVVNKIPLNTSRS